ncbi:MAG: helix-hairpin-helix domain-containing protein [Acetobacteraceae bacterium]
MKLRLFPLLALLFAVPAFAQTPSAPTRPTVPPPAAVHAPVAPKAATAAPAATPTPAASAALVDVNSADAKTLDVLPGIGASRAQGIIANRPYLTKQDLLTKKIVPANVFKQIEPRIALVNINTASATDMAKILTGIGPARSAAIVAARPFTTPQDLVTKGVLTQSVFNGIKGLVTAS